MSDDEFRDFLGWCQSPARARQHRAQRQRARRQTVEDAMWVVGFVLFMGTMMYLLHRFA